MYGTDLTSVPGLDVRLDGGVLSIVINRPEAKNAMTVEMRQHLGRVVSVAEKRADVSVVVLAAIGDVFSSGVDVKELADLSAVPPTNPAQALREISKPVLAVVDGACVTGALEMVLSCDFVIASERARFADTHVRMGVVPRWGMTVLLPRAVGLARAKEISATGRWVDAREALQIGLVQRLVASSELDAEVADLTERLKDRAAVVREVMTLMASSVATPPDEGFAQESARSVALGAPPLLKPSPPTD